MNHLMIITMLTVSSPLIFASDSKPNTISWNDNFSDEMALKKNWSKYDRTVPDTNDKQRFWQLEDGVLRGMAYPKVHPVGVMRNVSGKDLRVTCRIKIGIGAGIYMGFNGLANGSDRVRPDQPTINLRRAGFHILENNQILFYDERYIHLTAEALKQAGAKTTINQQSQIKYAIEKNVWHDLKMEMRGNDLTLWFNSKQVSVHKMHSGNEEKLSFNFSVGHETKDTAIATVNAWFDDMMFENIN